MKTNPNARQMLFSGPMVRSLLSGTKTKTRRIIKVPEFVEEASDGSPHWQPRRCGAGWEFLEWSTDYALTHPLRCPYGQRGERLWVRERWATDVVWDTVAPRDIPVGQPIWYDGTGFPERKFALCGRWRASIHMPRWASRITLEIADVRVERLNEISGNDVLAEGVDNGKANAAMGARWDNMQRMAFGELWEEIHGPGSWGANPWVWVISFKRVGT